MAAKVDDTPGAGVGRWAGTDCKGHAGGGGPDFASLRAPDRDGRRGHSTVVSCACSSVFHVAVIGAMAVGRE